MYYYDDDNDDDDDDDDEDDDDALCTLQQIFNTFMHNVEHRKIFKVCLGHFSRLCLKGLTCFLHFAGKYRLYCTQYCVITIQKFCD